MAETSKPPGAEYELLTQRLLDALGQQATVETIELAHLKKFQGMNSGTKLTIDIWWEFHHAKSIHHLAFQCKDWNSPIKQEHVYAFRGILGELPKSPHGVMVTKTGYQKGAKLVARAHGITILELREPISADWEGRAKDIHITLVSVHPEYRNFTLMLPENHPETPDSIPPQFDADMEEMVLVNANGERVSSLREIADLYIPEGFEASDWESVEHRLTEILYSTPPGAEDHPLRLPVAGLSFEVRQTQNEQLISLFGDLLVKHILRDVLGEDIIAFGQTENASGNRFAD